MKASTGLEIAYQLLAKGVHFNEIQRFVDAASPPVDPEAETIPAPPPSSARRNGALDPETISTAPSELSPGPKRLVTATEMLAAALPATSSIDVRHRTTEFWDEVAALVERAR